MNQVDHNQLDAPLPFKIIYVHQHCGFVVAQALQDFKTSTILVYMILKGKGS